MTAPIDVLLVSMPFGPLMSPSLALSLLQPQVVARGLSSRSEYFTLGFAERIGEPLSCKITNELRAFTRSFVGEWIFSHALYDWDEAHDQRYISEVLLKPPSWLGRNNTRPPTAGESADCSGPGTPRPPISIGAPTTSPRGNRASSASPACSSSTRLAGAGHASQGTRCPTLIVLRRRQLRRRDGRRDAAPVRLRRRRRLGRRRRRVPGSGQARRSRPADRRHSRRPHAQARLPGRLRARSVSDRARDRRHGRLPFPDFADYFEQFGRSRFEHDWQPASSSKRRAAAGGASGCTAPSAA